jgi:ribulose-5-phosphate 4-epimerase/fuculose-1-phosphate aldolase
MAPGLVSRQDDLIEYYIKDSSTVDPKAKKGYSERFIHGELFKLYPSINCVVHSHAEEVLPYVTSGIPLKPIFHMAGFLGTSVPVFDIAGLYEEGEQQDMLIRNTRIGTALAQSFSSLSTEEDKDGTPDHTVVLMRRHGFTTHGTDIETAVYRSIYTKINAEALTKAVTLRSAFAGLEGFGDPTFDLEPLTEEMCRGCLKMNEGTQDKPWALWVKEVEATGLYINKG